MSGPGPRPAFNVEDTPEGILLTPIPAAVTSARVSARHVRALHRAADLWHQGVRSPMLIRGARVRILAP